MTSVIRHGVGRCEFVLGDVTVVLCEGAPTSPWGIEFSEVDVDALYVRLTEANLAPSAPVTYPWGWRAIGIQDPDGNQLDFVQQVNT